MKTNNSVVTFSLPNTPSLDQSTTESIGASNDDHQPHIPLLLRKSYARSKSSMHDELRHFRICLKWCALDHSTSFGKTISYLTFFIFAIIIPILTSIFIKIPSNNPLSFHKLVQLPDTTLAFLGFFTLTRFFKEYGLRQLLFLNGLNEDTLDVRLGYKFELDKAFKKLACILLPSLLVEFAHKILFFSTIFLSFSEFGVGVFSINSVMFLSGLASWVYRTGVFLLVCGLFRLTCELQILRLEGLRNMLEGLESEPSDIFREHRRIKDQLCVTSHRFRFFIVGCLVIISISQLGALLLVLASKSEKNFFNSGDLVVCSAVQLSGLFLCLLGAAKITHRAQGITSVATRWHILVTTSYTDAFFDHNNAQLPVINGFDQSSSNVVKISQDPLAFQTRQALVSYLEHNNGGITVYGFALDRGLLYTLFAFEFSLVLWILSKGIVLS